MTADIHALTGAYALDAVSGAERAEFERHLAVCESCAQEVAELQNTATRLALAATADPPADLKSRVLGEISAVRQVPPETTVVPLRRNRSAFAVRLSTMAAAVLLIAAVGLGVVVVRQNQQLDESRTQAAEMSEILRAGDAQVLSQDGGADGRMTVAMSRTLDRMMVLAELPNPPSGHDFQVWAAHGDTMVSAGLLNPDNGDATLGVRGFGDADHIAVTVEPDGGSPQPTQPPVMSVALPV